ncbi:MAG: hypothetical protein OXG05_12290 [Gammaproteobacteria bacterium]|nr:hypothetical protein [Gammaproteobacteria bacterium]
MSKGTKKQHLNGSVDILAGAMKAVFQEGMDATRAAVKEDTDAILNEMGEMETRLKEDTAQQIAKQETRFNTSLGKLQKSLIEQRSSTKSKSTSKRSTART